MTGTRLNFDDRDASPHDGCTLIEAGLIYASWATLSDGAEPTELLLWHWCDCSVWLANPEARPEYCDPRWQPAGGSGHDLISREPLHLEPSVFWPGCCGLHGWIRDGKWTPA